MNESDKLKIAYDYLNLNSKIFVEFILSDYSMMSVISEDSYYELFRCNGIKGSV